MDTQETRIFVAVIIASILLGVVITFFILTTIRQQKRNISLQRANIIAELNAMERERARIAADLHDELGPVLSVIRFQVDHARQGVTTEKETLEKASLQLDTMIIRLREIANNLMPSALQRKGLIPAILEFVDKVEGIHDLRIRFHYTGMDAISPEMQIHIYRTIQELIHNCIKHADANEIELSLQPKDNKMELLYKDDGKGFDIDTQLQQGAGIGLRSLRNRTEILDGELTAESKEGVGTAFLFRFPL